jgi:hypothetical protein
MHDEDRIIVFLRMYSCLNSQTANRVYNGRRFCNFRRLSRVPIWPPRRQEAPRTCGPCLLFPSERGRNRHSGPRP